MKDKWNDQDCYDRICSLISHDKTYNYKAKWEMIGLMLKMGEKFKLA